MASTLALKKASVKVYDTSGGGSYVELALSSIGISSEQLVWNVTERLRDDIKSVNLVSWPPIVSFPDPAFNSDKGLAHFARNLGLADSALPEIWRTNQIAFTC